MNKHGLQHWVFQFDRAKRRAGYCRYSRQTISLSEHFVLRNEKEEINDTVLHEIAHALAGKGNGHNGKWKAICKQVGATPRRCYGSHVDMPKGEWRADCPSCGKEYTRHRNPGASFVIYCPKCGVCRGRLTFNRTKGES